MAQEERAAPVEGAALVADDAVALVDMVVPTTWAREDPLTLAVTVPKPSVPVAASFESDRDHFANCRAHLEDCARCRFEAGYRGELRRGQPGRHRPNPSHAWGKKCLFHHPALGLRCWLCPKPLAWSDTWGVGCWICCHFGNRYASTFARLEVDTVATLTPSSLKKHAASPAHQTALKLLHAQITGDGAEEGQFTGASESVPRLEKFHLAGTIVSRRDSFQDFQSYARTVALNSSLPQQGGDFSAKACSKILLALGAPLYQQDVAVMRHDARHVIFTFSPRRFIWV